ncbi:DUF2779 domain-containing protein [Bowmanella denitrificans]|uniref:DUF2779 domain-containing protein n=1 Tax=Bowmanella denitrificans TaxID=366582 RepID=A0ABN0WLD3_9ALTE
MQIHKSDVAQVSAQSKASFATGNQVGNIAIQLYDPDNLQQILDPFTDGWESAMDTTQEWIKGKHPIFEGTFAIDGALALADVLKRDGSTRSKQWHMVEVKSATSVKDIHIEDTAFQYFVVSRSGVKLSGVSLACIDSNWTYAREGDYRGLLKEHDLTEQARALQGDVEVWLADAHRVARQRKEPDVNMGNQCNKPYECEFKAYCSRHIEQPEFPVEWLPRRSGKLKAFIEENQISDMREVPDHMLNGKQILVKECTVDNEYFLDEEGAQQALSQCRYPLYFLDFETINFGVPRWVGTRPYQQIPFQYSLHKISDNGATTHKEFLDLSGNDPSLPFAEQLIKDCGKRGSILVYNQAFEKKRIEELSEGFPHLAEELLALNTRVVDLLPVCQNFYYHPEQHGSWSIKKVLPNMVPELNYAELDGVQHGGAAMEAFVEAIHPETSDERKQELDSQLREYCKLDTWAMVRIWEYITLTQLIE